MPYVQSTHSHIKIYLLDENPVSHLGTILQSVASESALTTRTPVIEIRVIRNLDLIEVVSSLREEISILLVVVDDREHTRLLGGRLPRLPCPSIAFGYKVLDQVGRNGNVFFVMREITGVETISLLLSGAKGIIDVEALSSRLLLRKVVESVFEEEKKLNRLIAGRAYDELEKLIQMARSKWQIAPHHWNLLLALAEVPVDEIPGRTLPNMDQFTRIMARYEQVTGFHPTISNTARKIELVLDLVTEELNSHYYESQSVEEYDDDVEEQREKGLSIRQKAQLLYLPLSVRRLGFPKTLLPINGLDASYLHSRLYKGLRGIDLASPTLSGEIRIARATVSRDLH